TNLSFFQLKASEIKRYVNDISQYDKWMLDKPKKNQKLIELVNGNSIDIVPVEISQVYFNSLNYNPRPVIQSYSAYNGFLDSLNFKKYNSDTSPDFILYSLGTIDDRYGFFDESWTKLAMLSNYEPSGSLDNQIILSKSKKSSPLIKGNTQISASKLGQYITIAPTRSLQLTSVFIDYNLLGKLRRIFFKPPSLTMTITLENGEEYTYKAITTILKGGVIINKYIDTNDELEIFMNSKGELNTNILKIRFDPLEATWGLKDGIKLITTHFWVGDSVQSQMNHSDSVRATVLLNKFKPIESTIDNSSKDSLRVWVDKIKTHSQLINISGWAFLEFKENDSSKVSVILKSNKKIYELRTVNYNRPDLPLFYKRSDIKTSAYNASVLKSAILPNTYQIGIHLINNHQNIDAVYFTDKTVEIKNTSTIQKITGPKNVTAKISGAIDSATVDKKGEVLIHGWTIYNDKDTTKKITNVLLESNNDVYRISTNPITEYNIAKGKRRFIANLPSYKLQRGLYKVYIEVLNRKTGVSESILSDKLVALGVPLSISPIEITKVPGVSGEISKGIDKFSFDGNYLSISGWAVPDSSDFKGYKIELILKSNVKIYKCDVIPKKRPDVTAYYKNTYSLDDCGFEAIIQTKDLPHGTYQVGLFLHQGGKKSKLDFLDQSFIKK
ncbi:MAG: hypothetical protein K2U26_14195, partial [Cyclobacteriaceae bacterium]|nr:hypothetical protein [Cyclobacteriaceae bacterium]